MSETPLPTPAADAPLQFEHAETSAPPACAACSRALVDSYYEANGKLLCPACRDAVLAARTGGSHVLRFLRAWGLGLAAAVVGAVGYHCVRALSSIEFGLVYVGVGWLVGTGVARGAQGRGGVGYQLFAVALTWASVAWSLTPELVDSMTQGENAVPRAFAWVLAPVFSLVLPGAIALESPMMIAIIGFALWQAWKLNRRAQLALAGPFALAPAAVTDAPAVPEQSVA
jgi:hypothetical protein